MTPGPWTAEEEEDSSARTCSTADSPTDDTATTGLDTTADTVSSRSRGGKIKLTKISSDGMTTTTTSSSGDTTTSTSSGSTTSTESDGTVSDCGTGISASQKPTTCIEVTEAPDWPTGFDETKSHVKVPSRLFHWGPLIALAIISAIGSTTTYFAIMWWPINTLGGCVHVALFLFWNYMTLENLVCASLDGPGLVPFKWQPPKDKYCARLQYCKPCGGYKAPRSHHCSKCKRCTMKMDHHCPWINNCVGHRNHALFCRFLFFAIVGCVHALVVHANCVYHAIHIPFSRMERREYFREILADYDARGMPRVISMLLAVFNKPTGWYLQYGNGTEPIIPITFASFVAILMASALSFGVCIGLGVLLYMQLKYIKNNKTGIEEYIDQKACYARDEEEDGEWIYPYNLGWKRNVSQVLGDFLGRPTGNGIWWPVRKECNQFTLSIEQLRQKEVKKAHSREFRVLKDFKGGYFGTLRAGMCRLFFCQPINDEARISVKAGDEMVVTRGNKNWFYGHRKGDQTIKGWFPRICGELLPREEWVDELVEDTREKKE